MLERNLLQDSLNEDVMKELLAKTPNTYDLEFQVEQNTDLITTL